MIIPAKITLPAKLESLYDFMGFVSSHAREQGLSNEKISEIELAVEEIIVNIVNYAYKDSVSGGEVEVTCTLDDEHSFVVEIVDSGVSFNMLSASEPDVTEDIDKRQIGGLGIFFVKRLMDDVRYRREDGRNKLTLVMKKQMYFV